MPHFSSGSSAREQIASSPETEISYKTSKNMTQLCSMPLSHGSTTKCQHGEVRTKSTSWLRKSKSSKIYFRIKNFGGVTVFYRKCPQRVVNHKKIVICFLISVFKLNRRLFRFTSASNIHFCVNFELKVCFGCA